MEFSLTPKFSLMGKSEIEVIHNSSLRILSETGVNIYSREIRSLMKNAGASIKDDLRVLIPEGLVKNALSSAPSAIKIFDRNGESSMVLEGRNSYFGTGSDLEYTIDHRTGERRRSRLEDVERSASLCDKLSNIDFVMSFSLPEDTTEETCELEQFETMLNSTIKPIIMTIYSGVENFEKVHNLACESCGGADNFKKYPNYIMYGQFVSPLQHDQEAVNRLIFCAENRIPLIYVPTIMMGASGPVTLAGAISLANAECLAGLVMHQLKSPGAPFIYGGCISPLDMRTTVFSYGSPEWRIADLALSELSCHYNLPVFGTAGATDSKVIDAQAGAEWAASLLVSSLAGTNLIHDVGYLESGMTGSLESIIICDEIIGSIKKITKGFKINPETLAIDIIDKVGPAGSFMGEEHTLNNFRDKIWYPSIFSRNRYENWRTEGFRDIQDLAKLKVKELLDN
jgi:trimethylamine---corrinoid protein Co-methyltransferase